MSERRIQLTKSTDIEISADELAEAAGKMPPGSERDRLLKQVARRRQVHANAERWANSPGLQPPK